MFVVKYAQVLDFVLKTIYDVNLQAPNRYLSLPSVVHSIGYASSFSGIGDMADYLETRGFIRRTLKQKLFYWLIILNQKLVRKKVAQQILLKI